MLLTDDRMFRKSFEKSLRKFLGQKMNRAALAARFLTTDNDRQARSRVPIIRRSRDENVPGELILTLTRDSKKSDIIYL